MAKPNPKRIEHCVNLKANPTLINEIDGSEMLWLLTYYSADGDDVEVYRKYITNDYALKHYNKIINNIKADPNYAMSCASMRFWSDYNDEELTAIHNATDLRSLGPTDRTKEEVEGVRQRIYAETLKRIEDGIDIPPAIIHSRSYLRKKFGDNYIRDVHEAGIDSFWIRDD